MAKTTNPQPVDAALIPRFGAIPTFMRLPHITDPAALDIALIGVPWDGGTTNRAGARHGPREVRNMSSFIRKVHHVSRIAPYELCRIADLGDAPVNPIDLMDSLKRIETFFAKVHAAGAAPLSVGGDHLITLPIFRAIAAKRPVGMVHVDAHSDTNDRYFGDNKYTHGTPFRRAIEEGLLDPRRTIQIGIRGSIYAADDMAFAEKTGIRVMYMEEFARIGVDKAIAIATADRRQGSDLYQLRCRWARPGLCARERARPRSAGLTTLEAQHLIRGLQGLDIVGGDVVEVSPPFDPSGNTALVGANIMFEILCVLADARARGRPRKKSRKR